MNKIDFDSLYYQYLLFDDPIPYKNFLVYPCKMKDCIRFLMARDSISIDKNSIIKDDPLMAVKVIGMSYLDFLIYLYRISNGEDKNLMYSLLIFSLCLQTKVELSEIPNGEIAMKVFYNKDEFVLDRQDFENIRKIICYQNDVELEEDDKTPPALKEQLKEAREFNMKNSPKMGDLEDQIVCLSIATGLSSEYIKNMSYRKFKKALDRVELKMQYQIAKEAETVGFVTFKEPIKHWMRDLDEEDKYADVKTNIETFEKQSGLKIDTLKN